MPTVHVRTARAAHIRHNESVPFRRLAAALTAVAFAMLLAGCTTSVSPGEVSDAGGPGATGQDVSLEALYIGECVNDANVSGVITSFTLIDCTEPHDSEVYESIPMEDADYPGERTLQRRAEKGCESALARFVGIPLADSRLDYEYYVPAKEGWGYKDEIDCLIRDTDASGHDIQSTGSLSGSKR